MFQPTTIQHHKDLLNELAQQEPCQVRNWLETVWASQHDDSIRFNIQFNWLGLFEVAAFNANRAAEIRCRQESLAWANVAKAIYTLLTDHKQRRPQHMLNSLMQTRANLIAIFGHCSPHEILDANDLIVWFFAELELSYADAIQEAALWTTKLDLDMMRKLRNIKDRLHIIGRLLERQPGIVNEQLAKWLSLLPQLP